VKVTTSERDLPAPSGVWALPLDGADNRTTGGGDVDWGVAGTTELDPDLTPFAWASAALDVDEPQIAAGLLAEVRDAAMPRAHALVVAGHPRRGTGDLARGERVTPDGRRVRCFGAGRAGGRMRREG
jgi:hypothetical protein